MFRTTLITVTAVVVSACGNFDPFFVEAKAAAICQHVPNQRFQVPDDVRAQFALLPPEMQAAGVEVSRTFDFDISAQLPPELKDMVDLNFNLTSIKLTATAESTDLGFVQEAHVTLQPAAGTTLAQRQFDYVRTQPQPRVVTWNGDAFDVAAYLQSGNLKYLVSLTGTLPAGDVVVDVEACAEAGARLNYL
jgi:hypothetical protein